jgi:WD40 repeat protein
VEEVDWRPDGRLLAVGCNDQLIYIWDTAAKQPLSALEGHENDGIHVKFSHSGRFLVSSCLDHTIRLWDPVRGQELVRAAGDFIDLSADDQHLSLTEEGGHLELWGVSDGGECLTLHHGMVGNRTPRPADGGVQGVAFGKNERLLASGGGDGVRLWDLSASVADIAHLRSARSTMLFRPGDGSLLTYCQDGARLWPVQSGGEKGNEVIRIGPPRVLNVPSGKSVAGRVCWVGDGRSVLSVDEARHQVVRFSLAGAAEESRLPAIPNLDRVAVSPDGHWAATGTWPVSHIRVWDIERRELVTTLVKGARSAAFSPDGHWLVTSPDQDQVCRFWHIGSWRPGPEIESTAGQCSALAFAPDGSLLAFEGTSDHSVKLIRVDTGQEVATLTAPEPMGISGLCFSADGSRLAVATSGHIIHVWDLRAIRRQLSELGLDWKLPAYRDSPPARPIRIDVPPPDPRALLQQL